MRRVPVLTCLLAVVCACAAPAGASAADRSPAELQRAEDQGVSEIIVGRDPGLSAAERGDLRSGAGVSHVADMALPNTEVVRAPAGGLVEAVDALEAEPGVRYAEPNGIVRIASNDPLFPQLWGLQNPGTPTGTVDADIDAPEAWARSTGAGQTVAVVDSGTTFDQQDLQGGALWTNPGETGTDALGRDKRTNGLDDDANGLVDDWGGWDFVDGDGDPTDLNGHGTHVTGTIAARKDNGIGVAGVAPSAQVVTLRAIDAAGAGSLADLANAFTLAGDRGIPIVNASVQEGFSQAVEDAIARHPNTLYVVAAGNATAAGAAGTDNDTAPVYPCSLTEANVICVGASDQSDAPAAFSNFGKTSVDLFAPGVNIISTYIDSLCAPAAPPCFAADDGTSMAAPHVSGTLALMRAANPALSAVQLKAALLANVDPKAALSGKSVTGGRLNANAAVAAVSGGTTTPPPPASGTGTGTATGTGTGTGATAPAGGAPAGAAPAAPAPAPAVGTSAGAPPAAVPSVGVTAVLGRPSITAGALTARHGLTLRFTLDRATTVKLTMRRGSRTVATVSILGRKGVNRYVLRKKVGGKRLARGRYRLRLQATGTAKTYTVAVAVR